MSEIILINTEDLQKLIFESCLKALQLKDDSKEDTLKEYLNIQEASLYLNIPKASLYILTSKRQIPFIKRHKRLIFKKSDLAKWLEEGRKLTRKEILKKNNES